MATTFEKISTVSVGAGGVASIDFSSIPQTYTDLKLLISVRTNRSAIVDALEIKFNNSTTGRSYREGYGTGTSTAASSGSTISGGYVASATATALIYSNTEIYIPNYASANYKSSSSDNVSENNDNTSYLNIVGSIWSNTAAINQITIYMSYGTLFDQYSTATLYGIKKS